MQSIDIPILHCVFLLSRANLRIDATAIGAAAGVSATRAGAALCALERAGLVDASRARLTMVGLARAVATGAAGTGGRRIDLEAARHVAPPVTALPLAARSEYPPEYPPAHASL